MRTILLVVLVVTAALPSATASAAEDSVTQFGVALGGAVQSLPYQVKDADFSTPLNAVIAVSDSPPQLQIYEPESNTTFSVNLPLTPNCVSVSPDGLRAVVGHNAWISEVDLSTRTLVRTIPIAADVLAVVHGGNGYAYAFSTRDTVHSVHLATQGVTNSYSWRDPAVARLHPSGNRIYGADRNVTPDDIVRINIGAGIAENGVDSAYHGDYSFCGNVWITKDGLRLVTGCGNTFRSSGHLANDMQFAGKLSHEQRIAWTAHSLSGNTLAVLPEYTGSSSTPRVDQEIHYYTQDTLAYRGKAVLPSFVTNGTTRGSRGRWLFYNAAETKQYVIVQADATATLPAAFGMVAIDCSAATVTLDSYSSTVSGSSQTVAIGVTGNAGCGWKAISNAAWIETTSSGTGDGAVTLNVAANDSGASRSGTVAIGNATYTLTQSAAVEPVQAAPARRATHLDFRVVDAEYSKSLDAIVAVAETPNRLHIYRPTAQSFVSVALPAVPSSVSVGPDGKFAAVGHNRSISYVDLENGVLVKTLNVTTDVFDIVLAGNGFVYAFPRSSDSIRTVNIASDAETGHSGWSIYGGTLARLHPGGLWMYGANNGVSPSSMEKYDISAGTASYKYRSPYHGDYAICGNLWFSEEGSRIYTACGNVFRSTDNSTTDMTYAGKLGDETSIRWASHSQLSGSVAVLPFFQRPSYWWGSTPPARYDHEIHYYTPDFLAYQGKLVLPTFQKETTSVQWRGRWHFYDATATRQHVIVQSDPEAGMLYDFGIFTVDCATSTVTLGTTDASIGVNGGNLQVAVTASGGCGWTARSAVSWINTLSSGVGSGTVNITVSQNTSVTARTGTVTIGGATFTIQQAGVMPSAVVATATATTAVSVSWSSTPANHFEVWRDSSSGSVRVGTPVAQSFTDTTAAPGSAYIYKVRAVMADGSMSAFAADYAHTYVLTDASLVGVRVKAAHVLEPRAIVQGLRDAAGMPPAAFSDVVLASVTARRAHITELRDAINALRTALGLTPFGFSSLPEKSRILSYSTEEIRNAVR
jgi:hypothetical protein